MDRRGFFSLLGGAVGGVALGVVAASPILTLQCHTEAANPIPKPKEEVSKTPPKDYPVTTTHQPRTYRDVAVYDEATGTWRLEPHVEVFDEANWEWRWQSLA